MRQCPTCGFALEKNTFLKNNNNLLPESLNKRLCTYHQTAEGIYCQKCLSDALNNINKKLQHHENLVTDNFHQIPIVSIHSPVGWEYEVIGIVTGQSTTGTGVFSEIGASFTDFFGAQSGMYNQKLSAGEDLCFKQLRFKTLHLGGNAVVALDIDYSELGGSRGMIMVCTTATAVKVTNFNVVKTGIDSVALEKCEYSGEQINKILVCPATNILIRTTTIYNLCINRTRIGAMKYIK